MRYISLLETRNAKREQNPRIISSQRNLVNNNDNKKAVLPQGNRAMPQVFFSVEVRQQHSLQV